MGIKIFFAVISIAIFIYILWSSYYAKRLTLMKDQDVAVDVVNNEQIKKKGLLEFYVVIFLIFLFSFIIDFIF